MPRKKADEMTTEEIMKKVFPPEVRKAAKKALRELEGPKPKAKKKK